MPCPQARFEAKEEKQRSGKSGEGRCFSCGATGHLSFACPNAGNSKPGDAKVRPTDG